MVSILVLQVYSTAGTGVWRSSVMGSSGPSALFVSFSLPLLFFFSFNLFDSIAHKTAWHRNVYRDLESQIRSEARLVVPCTELRYGPMDREMLVSYYCDRGAWSRSRSLTFSTFLFYYRTGSMDDNAV